MVAGAGLAGLAGGIALTRSKGSKGIGASMPSPGDLGMTSKNVTHAAKNVGALAERTGRIAEQVRVASEAIGESGRRRKSPVEVVLEGLTARSSSASES